MKIDNGKLKIAADLVVGDVKASTSTETVPVMVVSRHSKPRQVELGGYLVIQQAMPSYLVYNVHYT